MEIDIVIHCKKGPEDRALELMEQEAGPVSDSILDHINSVLRRHDIPSLPSRVNIFVQGDY